MSSLILRLAGPLQSWGYRSRFSDRDTGLEPTKSGVVGLLCCALGRNRSQHPGDLAALKMHVRVDRQGTILKDFHTAGGGMFRQSRDYYSPTSSGAKGKNPVVTERYYLQDAAFLVALDGNEYLLQELSAALVDPSWPLCLGRRSCPPSVQVFVRISERDGATALTEESLRLPIPHLKKRWDDRANQYTPDLSPQRLRLVLECEKGDTAGEIRRDVPVAWPDTLTREYTVRFVREEIILKSPEVAE